MGFPISRVRSHTFARCLLAYHDARAHGTRNTAKSFMRDKEFIRSSRRRIRSDREHFDVRSGRPLFEIRKVYTLLETDSSPLSSSRTSAPRSRSPTSWSTIALPGPNEVRREGRWWYRTVCPAVDEAAGHEVADLLNRRAFHVGEAVRVGVRPPIRRSSRWRGPLHWRR